MWTTAIVWVEFKNEIKKSRVEQIVGAFVCFVEIWMGFGTNFVLKLQFFRTSSVNDANRRDWSACMALKVSVT